MLRREKASKNPSKRTQLLIPKIFAKGTIRSKPKKNVPKFKKDPFKEMKKLPILPTKVRKQTILAKKIEISQTERDKTIRISSELLEQHLKLRDISELGTFKTCDIEEPNKRIGGLSDVTEAHILSSKMELGETFTGDCKPDSQRLDIKRLEWPKVVSTEGPSTEESISSIAPPKYTKATSTAKKKQTLTELVGTYLKEEKISKKEVMGRPRKPRKYQRTQSKDAPHTPKLNVVTSGRGHAQLEKKSLFGARNHVLELGSRLSIRRRSGLEDTKNNNASQSISPEVCDTGQRADTGYRFLGPIYPEYSIFDCEQTPNSQRIKSRTLGVTSYFGNTLVSLTR